MRQPTQLSEYDIKYKQDLKILRAEFQNAMMPYLHEAEMALAREHTAIEKAQAAPRRLTGAVEDIQALVWRATQGMLPPGP